MNAWYSSPAVESAAWAGEESAIATGEPVRGTPLFLLHDGTGAAEHVRSLAAQLTGAVTVLALGGDQAESGLRTVEGIALRAVRRILELEPEGPYRIAGWSLGGIVAYEVAALLLGRDRTVEFLGVIHPSADVPGVSAGASDAADEVLRRAVGRYAPPPLPLAVHLFTAEAAGDAGPWRAWGAAEPKAAIRKVRVGASASPLHIPEGEALAEALAGEVRRAGESRAAEPEERMSPVFPLRFKGSRAPVYCIPGAGASVVGWTELAGALEPGWPVYGLEPRGMDGTSIPHTSVEAAAEYYLARIEEANGDAPIHLMGHSFGGWVALEMALRLLDAGRPVASLSLIDSSVPCADASAFREYDGEEAFRYFLEVLELAADRSFEIDVETVRALDEEGRLRLLHGRMVRFGMVPSRSAPAMLKGPFRVFSGCLRMTYRPRAVYPRPARLVLLRDSRRDPRADQLQLSEAAHGWKGWLRDVQVSVGPGNHMTALKRPHVEQLAALLPLGA